MVAEAVVNKMLAEEACTRRLSESLLVVLAELADSEASSQDICCRSFICGTRGGPALIGGAI